MNRSSWTTICFLSLMTFPRCYKRYNKFSLHRCLRENIAKIYSLNDFSKSGKSIIFFFFHIVLGEIVSANYCNVLPWSVNETLTGNKDLHIFPSKFQCMFIRKWEHNPKYVRNAQQCRVVVGFTLCWGFHCYIYIYIRNLNKGINLSGHLYICLTCGNFNIIIKIFKNSWAIYYIFETINFP